MPELSEQDKGDIEDFCDIVFSWFCRRPDEAHVEFVEGSRTTILEIHSHPDDSGALIGSEGSVVAAILRLVQQCGYRKGRKIIVEVDAPRKKERKDAMLPDDKLTDMEDRSVESEGVPESSAE